MAVAKKGNRWYAVVRIDGRQRWFAAGPLKRDALALEAEKLHKVARGEYREIKKATFAEFVEIWRRDGTRDLQPSTIDEYECYLRRHLLPRFGSLQMREVTTHAIQRYINDKLDSGLSGKSVRNHCAPLGNIMSCAVAWDYLAVSPMPNIKRPRREPHKKAGYLTAEKVKSLLAAADEPMRTLLLATIMTGARQSEILGLGWGQVDFDAQTISIVQKLYKGELGDTKTESSNRVIPMSPALSAALLMHKVNAPASELDLVFTNAGGRPMSKKACSEGLKRALSVAGLEPIRFHDLRHTFSSVLMANGENVKVIQELMGHSNSAMTMHYTHTFDGAKASAVQRLEAAILSADR